MSNKSTKPSIKVASKPTEDEIQKQVNEAFARKAEMTINTIVFNLCNGLGHVPTKEEGEQIVDTAVDMFGHLMKRLYEPAPGTEAKSE